MTVLISEREKPVKALSFLLEKPSLAKNLKIWKGRSVDAFIRAEAQKAGVS